MMISSASFKSNNSDDLLKQQSKHVCLHIFPPPMVLTELPRLVGNHLGEIVMATCPTVGRTGKERHNVVQVRVINLARLLENVSE